MDVYVCPRVCFQRRIFTLPISRIDRFCFKHNKSLPRGLALVAISRLAGYFARRVPGWVGLYSQLLRRIGPWAAGPVIYCGG